MKLSNTLWKIISVGCFLGAVVIIFSMWNSAVDSRDAARLNLEAARKLYTAAVTQKTDLDKQIAQIDPGRKGLATDERSIYVNG
jgi:hypothetical protein